MFDDLYYLAQTGEIAKLFLQGQNIDEYDSENIQHVRILKEIADTIVNKLDVPYKNKMLDGIMVVDNNEKPNLIIDINLSNLADFAIITENLNTMGYEKYNIHIIWVVTDFEKAKHENENNNFAVSENMLFACHECVAETMKRIISMNDELLNFIDGDIIILFDKKSISDVKYDQYNSKIQDELKANYINKSSNEHVFFLKKKGQRPTLPENLPPSLIEKLNAYVPKGIW